MRFIPREQYDVCVEQANYIGTIQTWAGRPYKTVSPFLGPCFLNGFDMDQAAEYLRDIYPNKADPCVVVEELVQ